MQVQKKRLLTIVAAASASAMLVAACGGDSASSGGAAAPEAAVYEGPVGDGEGELNILAWPGYAENGTTSPDVDWVTPFTEATGCKANVKVFGTSDEAVKLMQGGGWDVVSASGDASLRLIYGDNVQPVNMELTPNYADVFEGLKKQQWNSVNGQAYGMPHGRGANLLMYNTEQVSPAPDSWSVVFEGDTPLAGKVSAYDSPIAIADAAVYLMATKPELGITYPYALDKDQFAAAIALLEQQKGVVGEYWNDYLKQMAAFTEGTTLASTTWQVVANALQGEGVKVDAVKPKEGATGWSDTWMIAKDTPNINCAYKWLDWIASPEINAQAAEYFGEAPANSKACALTANKDHCAIFHADQQDYWNDVYYWNTPTTACLDGRTDVECVPYSEWGTAWTALRS
ncbi:MAG: ABC transporter substrate-binding protein [Actinobacteria bacterium]|nr:ABC transporter substrate-binding protein [Actinomycetota bacterium]